MKESVIAARYADAIYSEAVATGKSTEINNDLMKLKSMLASSNEFVTFIDSPALSHADREQVIDKLGASVGRLVLGLLVLLNQKKRLSLLPAIIEIVELRVRDANGEVEAFVTYAEQPDEKTRQAVVAKFSAITGKKLVLKETIDPSLLGGLQVQIGSLLYDISMRGRLEKLKNSLVN